MKFKKKVPVSPTKTCTGCHRTWQSDAPMAVLGGKCEDCRWMALHKSLRPVEAEAELFGVRPDFNFGPLAESLNDAVVKLSFADFQKLLDAARK